MAVALALLTSLAYGLSNYVGPRLSRDTSLFVVLLVGQSCALVLAAVVVAGQGVALPGAGAVGYALLAWLGNAGGLILLYRAAAIGPLSIVMPVGSLGAGLPVAVGLAGGDPVTAAKVLGTALALAGVTLVARRPTAGDADVGRAQRGRALVLAAGSTVCFGVFLAAIDPAADDAAGWAVMFSRCSLVAVLATIVLRQGAARGLRLRRLPVLAVPGLLLFTGTLAYAAATREGDLSLVSVVGSLFPVVTVALAVGIDRERISSLQTAGVVATIAGVVVLSMP